MRNARLKEIYLKETDDLSKVIVFYKIRSIFVFSEWLRYRLPVSIRILKVYFSIQTLSYNFLELFFCEQLLQMKDKISYLF